MSTMPCRKPMSAEAVKSEFVSGYPEPFQSRMGAGTWRSLGDHFGLTQFGVSYETLGPAAHSSLRHWHTLSDEFVYMIEGELVLRTNDGEFPLLPGMCVGFKADDKNGRHLVNLSSTDAKFVVIGSRVPGDVPLYPDDDLAVITTEAGCIAVHKDGTPYS